MHVCVSICVSVCLSCIIWLLSNCWAVYFTQCQNFKLVVTVTQQFGTSLYHHYGLDCLTFSSKSLFTKKSHKVIQLRFSCLTSLPGPASRGHDLINKIGFDFFCLTQMRQRPNNFIQLLLGLFTLVTPCLWEWAVIFQNKEVSSYLSLVRVRLRLNMTSGPHRLQKTAMRSTGHQPVTYSHQDFATKSFK